MRPRFCCVLLACGWSISTSWAATHELDPCGQSIVVLADSWTSTTGVLNSFERDGTTHVWKEQTAGIPVVLGRSGLGTGLGLIRADFEGVPIKKEGDDRAPAGIFRLSSAFGYAPARSAGWIKLPYLALSKRIEGIDDSRSRYYNKLVDRSTVAKVDWRSFEQMLREDALYKWGVVVGHNQSAISGAGSCIFLHIWKNASSPTAGCTAMSERDLVRLLRWLDPARRPVLIQMPRAAYRSIRSRYGLPPDHS